MQAHETATFGWPFFCRTLRAALPFRARVVGIGLGYDFNRNVGVSVNYDYFRPKFKVAGESSNVPVNTWSVGFEYRF